MKYHSRRREGRGEAGAGDQGFHELKGCYAFSPPFFPPPSHLLIHHRPLPLYFFLPFYFFYFFFLLLVYLSCKLAVTLHDISIFSPPKKEKFKVGRWLGGLAAAPCVCFLFSLFFLRTTRIMTMAAPSPLPPPHIPLCSLLSPCLRFGFGACFEPPQ